MKNILFLLILLLFGCSDPVNKAISEFKKSELSKTLNECGGLNATYTYKVINYGKLKLEKTTGQPPEDESVLVVEMIKELVKGKPVQIHHIFRYNKETFIFKKYSIFWDEKNEKFWTKDELKEYSSDDFCKDKIPQVKVSSPPVANSINMEILYDKYVNIATSGIDKEEFKNIINNDKNLYLVYDTPLMSKYCLQKSQFGLDIGYSALGIKNLDLHENCTKN
jgi:hypothetical protein